MTYKFHAGKLATSARLQSVHKFLSERGDAGATGLEIAARCNVLNPSGVVSELRANGIDVDCEYQGKADSGAMVFRYKLRAEQEALPF